MGDRLMAVFKEDKLSNLLSKQLLRNKSIFLSILFSLLSIGIYTTLSYENFLHLQAQNVSQLSVFNEIIKPLSGIAFILGLLMSTISASQLVPYLNERGQISLLRYASLKPYQLMKVFFKINITFVLIPVLYFFCIQLFFSLYSEIEIVLALFNTVILLLGLIFYSFLIQVISVKTHSVIVSVLTSFSAIVLVISLDQLFSWKVEFNFLTIFNSLFLQSREGVVSFKELIHLSLWAFFIIFIYYKNLKELVAPSKTRKSIKFFYYFLSLSMTIVALKLVDFITPDIYIPISQTAKEKLPQYYKDQLRQIEQPIKITAVVDSEQSKDEVIKGVDHLKQYNQGIVINFSNRQAFNTNELKENSQIATFVSIQIGANQLTIRYPFSESAVVSLAKTIEQLHTKKQQWIVFMQGHEEASIFGKSARSLSLFYARLKAMGWPIIEQDFRKNSTISNNTRLVVIANSKQAWLKSEVDILINYLKNGGHLLLMREAEDKLPKALVEYIGIEKVTGNLIDEKGFASGTPHPAILIIDELSQHALMNNIQSLIALPWSVGLESSKVEFDNSWQESVALSSHNQVWSELNSEQNQPEFNQSLGEVRKSYKLAISLEREFGRDAKDKKTQRILVVGDSSFLSDAAINNYANQQLAVNMVSWLLSSQNQLIEIPYKDNSIETTVFSHFMLSWFLSFIFPFLFFLVYVFNMNSNRRQES